MQGLKYGDGYEIGEEGTLILGLRVQNFKFRNGMVNVIQLRFLDVKQIYELYGFCGVQWWWQFYIRLL